MGERSKLGRPSGVEKSRKNLRLSESSLNALNDIKDLFGIQTDSEGVEATLHIVVNILRQLDDLGIEVINGFDFSSQVYALLSLGQKSKKTAEEE